MMMTAFSLESLISSLIASRSKGSKDSNQQMEVNTMLIKTG